MLLRLLLLVAVLAASVSAFPDAETCSNSTTCSDCLGQGCGWCSGVDNPASPYAGTCSSTPLSCTPDLWFDKTCPVDPCTTQFNDGGCFECTRAPLSETNACGFCQGMNVCMSGNAAADGCSSGLSTFVSNYYDGGSGSAQCQGDNPCSAPTSCDSCLTPTTEQCYWCSGHHSMTQGSCNDIATTNCYQRKYTDACPTADPCANATSCWDCVYSLSPFEDDDDGTGRHDDACGWCETTQTCSSSHTAAGSDPPDGVCVNETWVPSLGTCSEPRPDCSSAVNCTVCHDIPSCAWSTLVESPIWGVCKDATEPVGLGASCPVDECLSRPDCLACSMTYAVDGGSASGATCGWCSDPLNPDVGPQCQSNYGYSDPPPTCTSGNYLNVGHATDDDVALDSCPTSDDPCTVATDCHTCSQILDQSCGWCGYGGSNNGQCLTAPVSGDGGYVPFTGCSGTAYYFPESTCPPVDPCVNATSCSTCLDRVSNEGSQCNWCPIAKQCISDDEGTGVYPLCPNDDTLAGSTYDCAAVDGTCAAAADCFDCMNIEDTNGYNLCGWCSSASDANPDVCIAGSYTGSNPNPLSDKTCDSYFSPGYTSECPSASSTPRPTPGFSPLPSGTVPPSDSSSTPVGAIVGGTVGGVVVIGAAVLVMFVFRRQLWGDSQDTETTPLVGAGGGGGGGGGSGAPYVPPQQYAPYQQYPHQQQQQQQQQQQYAPYYQQQQQQQQPPPQPAVQPQTLQHTPAPEHTDPISPAAAPSVAASAPTSVTVRATATPLAAASAPPPPGRGTKPPRQHAADDE